MAINLSGTVREKIITEMFIPAVQKPLVSSNFVTTKTGINAKSIKIWGLGSVAAGDYAGGDVAGHPFTDNSVDLLLDQKKYVKENVERIDSYEAAVPVLQGIVPLAGQAFAEEIEKSVWAMLTATTSVVPTIALDETNVLEWVGSMKSKLTNLGAPMLNRKLAVTSEIANLISLATFGKGSDSIATEAGRDYFITRFAGFDIYESAFLVNGATTGKFCIASVPQGAALGIGYNELGIEAVSGQFYDCVKGLNVYGTKLVKNEFIVKCDVTLS